MTPSTDLAASSSPAAKPRFAYAIATVLGTGYLKPGPGTWGSVVGLLIAVVSNTFSWFYALNSILGANLVFQSGKPVLLVALIASIAVWLFRACLGVKPSRQGADCA